MKNNMVAENEEYWSIPVRWEMYGVVRVPVSEAATLKEAIEIAVGPDTPLPEGDYVDESCAVGVDDPEEIRSLYNEGRPDAAPKSEFQQYLEEQLKNPSLKKEYGALEAEYAAKQALIDARKIF